MAMIDKVIPVAKRKRNILFSLLVDACKDKNAVVEIIKKINAPPKNISSDGVWRKPSLSVITIALVAGIMKKIIKDEIPLIMLLSDRYSIFTTN